MARVLLSLVPLDLLQAMFQRRHQRLHALGNGVWVPGNSKSRSITNVDPLIPAAARDSIANGVTCLPQPVKNTIVRRLQVNIQNKSRVRDPNCIDFGSPDNSSMSSTGTTAVATTWAPPSFSDKEFTTETALGPLQPLKLTDWHHCRTKLAKEQQPQKERKERLISRGLDGGAIGRERVGGADVLGEDEPEGLVKRHGHRRQALRHAEDDAEGFVDGYHRGGDGVGELGN
ncbi:hypothetical protein MUK42_18398 [Musa troglodytarum]|uniref:Uncharacterized protein n=1 Tax=Musa troglodytarum TaxID=320322 RepID=A0A9E7JJB7_9LILI|nr:hypothetical protein MUK42_18398 [Musa troglodytarum]